jgi:putative addiction module CopG family antidote
MCLWTTVSGFESLPPLTRSSAAVLTGFNLRRSSSITVSKCLQVQTHSSATDKHCEILLLRNVMNVSLTPELERFVGEKVESGLYNNASEVVREGLCLMKEQDEVRLRWREQIERGWQEANPAFDLLASRPGIGHAREDLTNRPLKLRPCVSDLQKAWRKVIRASSLRLIAAT